MYLSNANFKLYKDIWYLCALDKERPKTFSIKHISDIKIGDKEHSKDLSKYSNDTKFSWEESSTKILLTIRIDKRSYFLYQNVFIHKKINYVEEGEDLVLTIETFDDYGLKIFFLLTSDACKSISINDKDFFREMVNEL